MNTENSKPEWFQLSQSDAFEPKPARKRALRVMALATPLLVLGAGLVYAQSQNSPVAVATALPQSSAAAAPSTQASDPIAITQSAATPASAPIRITQAAATTQRATITITKPGIKLPSGGGEDDSSPAILTAPAPSPTTAKPSIATMPSGGSDDGGDNHSDGDDD